MTGKLNHFRDYREEIRTALHHRLQDTDWDGQPIHFKHGPFRLSLDVHAELLGYASHVVTRMRAAYINRDGFRFRIKRRSFVLDLATMMGMQDIEIGEETFDREFVIQANSSEEVRRLLAEVRLRETLISSPIQRVEVRDDEGWFGPEFPGEIDELYLEADGRITEVEKIEALFYVFADMLDRLCQIGSAYEDDPKIEL
ncbi:MAG: DUF3137 domain-containing protein [Acidobacteriota bacterium]|nr:MAG: DUF3137 domain-containing protein [Acidobacteriota bacterium]